jgi:serine/threonine protein kinase
VGFPEMISHIEGGKTAEILMEALGPNLRKLLKQCPGNIFTKTTVYMIIIQLIKRVRILHQMGYVHNDLKLDNILVGHKDP